MKGTTASWTGTWISPQYQEMSVKDRIEAGNATGNAKLLNVFFKDG
jgi:hypothetical protein